MGLLGLLEAVFCGRVSSEGDRLKREISDLGGRLDDALGDVLRYKERLEKKTADYKAERDRRRAAESDRNSFERKYEAGLTKIARLEAEVEKLEADVEWFEERRKTLEKALQDATVIPDIPLDEESLTLYDFSDDLAAHLFGAYDVRPADDRYYLLPYEKWVEILTPIQAEVKESLVRWRTNVSDCDDWAYVMGGIVTQYFAKAGVSCQGAFMIIWDITGENRHAYNGFIDDEKNVWVYEPQSGEIIGKLGETPDPYESNWLWFPGASR